MLNITQHRTIDELEELRTCWNALLSRTASDTVFLTWEWCTAWWRNYGAGRQLFTLAAWEGRELVGVAPLYLDKERHCGTTWERLRFLGDGSMDSDYLDCFVQPGREKEVIGEFVRFLSENRRMWNWLDLAGSLQESPNVQALVKCAKERGWSVTSGEIRCLSITLPAQWEEYLKTLEPRFRTKVRSSLAVIDRYLGQVPARCASEEQLRLWLPEFFDLHTRRWATRSEPGVFRNSARCSFYREFSQAALAQGWLAFHRLAWGERSLAYQYGLVYRNRFHLLQEGYDPAFNSIRPGMALRAWLMRYWIQTGLQEYDFLAGIAPHKLEWEAREKLACRVVLVAAKGSRIAGVDLPRLRSRARELIGARLPKVVLSLRKQLHSLRARHRWSLPDLDRSINDRRTVRQAARWLVAHLYSWSPLGAVGRSAATRYTWRKNGTPYSIHRRIKPVCHILIYHRVNDEGDPFLNAVPVSTFRAQMQYLVRNFPILTLDQIASGQYPEGQKYCTAITFDDGYRDNFLCALPILRSLNIPATIFLATGCIETGDLPWYDQVRLAFKLTKRSYLSMVSMGGPQGGLETLVQRVQMLEHTLGWLRGLLLVERLQATRELFGALGVSANPNLPNQMLSWDDIRQMRRQGMAFGAHTVTHPALSKISASEVQREIEGSKQTIENHLQLGVSHFAYPFGGTMDFTPEVKRVVQRAGFKTAATTIWGFNEPDHDRFELRRFSPWEPDSASFAMKLDWYRFANIE